MRHAAKAWIAHDTPRTGAAVAFYTLVALSPMVFFVLTLLSLLIGRVSAETQMVGRVHWLVGLQESNAVGFLLQNARRPISGWIATIVGLSTLLFGLVGLAGEVRTGLNTIWASATPSKSRVHILIRDKSVALAMVFSMALLLTLSLLVSTAVVGFGRVLLALAPFPAVVMVASFTLSVGITSLLFALMFRYVPMARPTWRESIFGAVLTGVLFTLGKALMDHYLIISESASAYGAAGSLIVVTLWVYYSAQVFFFGAECTHAYADWERAQSASADLGHSDLEG